MMGRAECLSLYIAIALRHFIQLPSNFALVGPEACNRTAEIEVENGNRGANCEFAKPALSEGHRGALRHYNSRV